MTNGEKLKEIFPYLESDDTDLVKVLNIDNLKSWWNTEYKEPTTKNDLPHCQHTDEEIAKSFIEDVEAVKEQLPCGEQMDFPNTFDEFANEYGFKDKDEIYTNGSELISVFRVKQWLEHISTTKNESGVDCISRQEAIDTIRQLYLDLASQKAVIDLLKVLPSVTPQESRWIPVSEKLPNDRDWYLGIFKEPDTNWINPLPFICDYVGRETKATTKEHWILRGFTDWDDYHIDYYFNLECVAWMPLPKAYREVVEE